MPACHRNEMRRRLNFVSKKSNKYEYEAVAEVSSSLSFPRAVNVSRVDTQASGP